MTKQEILNRINEVREHISMMDRLLTTIGENVLQMEETYEEDDIRSVMVTDFFSDLDREPYPAKAIVACKMLDCLTIGELCEKSISELKHLRYIGSGTIRYMTDKLGRHGLKMKR